MNAYFSTRPRQERLAAAVSRWVGTRFLQGAASPGVGVDCVRFVREVYRDCGVDVSALDTLPAYSLGWGVQQERSQILEWLHATADRRALRLMDPTDEPLDGDLLLLRRARCAHHLGLRCRGLIWHVGLHAGVSAIGSIHDLPDPLIYRLYE